jgi:hypothetical protein
MGHPAERSHRHNDCFGCGDGSASRCAWSRHASRNAGSPLPLLHQEPPTLLLIKLELDRSGCFGRLGVGGLDRPEHFPGFVK